MDTKEILDIMVSQALHNVEKAISSAPEAVLLSERIKIRMRNIIIKHAEDFFVLIVNSLTVEELKFWANQVKMSDTKLGKSVNEKSLPLMMQFMGSCMEEIFKLAEEEE